MKNFTKCIIAVILLSLFYAESSKAQWSIVTMTSARYRLAAAANGNIAVFACGIGQISIPPNVADIYSSVTGGVTSRSMSRGRTDLAGTSVGSKILFAGGADEWILSVFTNVEIYDGVTSGWSGGDLSVPRSKLAAASSGSKAFFGGGIDFYGQQKVYKVVDVYDTVTSAWSAMNMSQARHSLTASSANGKVVFAGGADFSGQVQNRVDIFDVAGSTWTIDSLSEARSNLTSAAVGNKIYFAGGINAAGVGSKVVDIYDVTSGTWTHDSLSVGRGNLSASSVGDLVFFAGGCDGSLNNISDVVDIYNTTTQTWGHTNLVAGRGLAAATSLNDLFMIGGGIGDGQLPLNTIEIYSVIAGVNDLASEKGQFNIFPNPVGDNVHMKLINTISNGTLEIVNELGQTVYSTRLNDSNMELNINFESFTKGVYSVKIYDGKNTTIKKFIKL